MNFNILKTAAIPKTLFAQLVGVSHAAVSHWEKEGGVHPLREKKVKKLLGAIERAVAAKDLPIPGKGSVELIEKRVAAIKKHLDAPAP